MYGNKQKRTQERRN